MTNEKLLWTCEGYHVLETVNADGTGIVALSREGHAPLLETFYETFKERKALVNTLVAEARLRAGMRRIS